MIHFMLGRCQWILRPLPWYLESTESDGATYYRIGRQWFLGAWTVPRDRCRWFKGEPTMRCFSFGPIELRRLRVFAAPPAAEKPEAR